MSHALTKYLEEAGISQEAFAQSVGVTQPMVSKFLSGQIRRFNQETAERIADVTSGKVTVLDCVHSTPYFLNLKGQGASPKKPGPKTKKRSAGGSHASR